MGIVQIFHLERVIFFFNCSAWPVIDDEIRRSLARRLPYGIFYSEEKEEIFILAVMNLHRKPGYWKHRI